MQSHFKPPVWLFTVAVIAAASVMGCSTGEPAGSDANAEQAGPSDASNGAPGSQSPGSQIFVSDNGFIKVGIGTDVDDVYPSGLDPSCVSPGPGYPVPADLAPRTNSPPVPGYLPEGSVLDKEHHNLEGRHIANTYVGPSNNFRVTITHGICGGGSIPAETHWELVTVAGRWGILFEGACFEGSDGGCDWDPHFARTLWLETDQGYVELRSAAYPLDKVELLRVAGSLPAFDR